MTKQSRNFMGCFAIASLAMTSVIGLSAPVAAQDSGYVPPPMFEDMTPPMVRPEGEDGYIVAPRVSSPTIENAPVRPSPVPTLSAPRLVPEAPNAPSVPKMPPSAKPKMMAPIVEPPQKPARPESKPQPKPQPKAEPASKPALEPASKPVGTRESAITGPKTMPSLPVHGVDEQVIHDVTDANATDANATDAPSDEMTILERVNQRKKAEEKTPEIKAGKAPAPVSDSTAPAFPAPTPNVPPAAFDIAEQGALKKIIPFEPGQIGLEKNTAYPIVAAIMTRFKDKDGWRVQIKSFATPHGAGVSSDRRIALARALSLRSILIAQGVPASVIDVLAEGLQSDAGAPADRIDLYLYGPKT